MAGWVSTMAPDLPVCVDDRVASAVHRTIATDAELAALFPGGIIRRDVHDPNEAGVRPRCIVFLFSVVSSIRFTRIEKNDGVVGIAMEFSDFFPDLAANEASLVSVANRISSRLYSNGKLQVDGGPVLAQKIFIPRFTVVPTMLERGARYYAVLEVHVTYRQDIQDRSLISVFQEG